MPNLIHLDLTGNREVTDAGLEHLAATKTLRKLSLIDTAVTQDGINRLQAQLPEYEI
ncbi:hypothetical protein [Roseimaritima ulvae]|uniref:Leucine Rich repeats (2 copies) n=1 Tax=Roseimaritima ulvae TaxID=980254 RepID=A0A5B9QPI4_9BACT|nr:hypothetical protein [Roseimaritima ulvae]QEG39812.1 hypothetical protein UC8_18110 [Roseimaritima ulvae]